MAKTLSPITLLMPLWALFLIISSCSVSEKHRPIVAVSIPPQATLLREIAGDSVDVVTLLRPDSNPETFEITVTDMRSIHDADAYLTIGHLPFESALLNKIRTTTPNIKFYDSSDGIDLIYGTHDHCHNHGHSHENDCEGHSSLADPHTWSSVQNLKMIAANMLDALAETNPENAEYFRGNYNRLVARLDSLDNVYRVMLTSKDGSTFLVWHPSLTYLARDYGLNQLAIGQENKEASVSQFRDRIDRAAASGVDVCFIQRNMDASSAENLARQLGLQVVEINSLNPDWEGELNNIVNALAK